MKTCNATVWTAIWSLAALILVGCGGESGPPKTVVKGKIHNAGQPLDVKPMTGLLKVEFQNMSEKDRIAYPAVVDKDGMFTVQGNTGTGVTAGKYRVVISWQDDFTGPDKLKKKFDEKNTKIIREIPSKDPIDIDVSKNEG